MNSFLLSDVGTYDSEMTSLFANDIIQSSTFRAAVDEKYVVILRADERLPREKTK
jgi:hypothetical protein